MPSDMGIVRRRLEPPRGLSNHLEVCPKGADTQALNGLGALVIYALVYLPLIVGIALVGTPPHNQLTNLTRCDFGQLMRQV